MFYMQIFKPLLMASKKITFMKYFTMIVIMQKKVQSTKKSTAKLWYHFFYQLLLK